MIARQMVVLAMAVLAVAIGGLARSASSEIPGKNVPPGTMHIHGAGATFPAPLYKKWLEEYHKRWSEVAVSDNAIGSGEGIKQFMAGTVDFWASDAALSDAQMAEVTRGMQLVPAVAGLSCWRTTWRD